MVEPLNVRSGDLETLADGIVDGPISNNDISTLTKRRNNGRDGGERLGVDYAAFSAQVSGNISLSLDVNILGAVELGRSAGADAVSS